MEKSRVVISQKYRVFPGMSTFEEHYGVTYYWIDFMPNA